MSSLVSEFIINPVLRQARRFSEISRTTLVPEPDASSSDNLAVASDSEAPAPRHATDAPAVTPPDRPLSADTLSPTVEAELPPSEPARAPPESFPITVPMQVPKREALPADDGMGALRKRLIEIQGQEIRGEEKARLMHEVLMEGYRKSRVTPQQGDPPVDALPAGEAWQQTLPSGPLESLKFWQHPPGEPSSPEKFVLTAEDVRPTYAPAKPTIPGEVEGARVLGCQHYKRNIKLQCSTCNKWYTWILDPSSTIATDGTATGTTIGRRRHSSHASNEAQARFLVLDRLARSASPAPTPGLPPSLTRNPLHGAIEEEESDNDILNLWGRFQRRSEEDSDSMSTDLEEEDDEYDEEDDDDDDDNDFMLIGHR
ncbi:hypothetical protein CGCS363_v002636 [Colletotrichum siamense]|uniref:uncharacterized protein n=1 Tax=Colletotrichum siamense TaxID=690259 RepID=UPI0018730F48|nr:uncharacterized protein CGCS363_v002636 [Colletotrichum siamense]KAF5510086.1 hypothetical protein CGCS363_v002636 [Colletotrichum siamense]